MKLHEVIKYLRRARGLRQGDISDKLNIERQAYQKIEAGQTALTTDRLEQIAEVLGLKPEEIYAEAQKVQLSECQPAVQNKDSITRLLEKNLANQQLIIENLQEQNRLLLQYLNNK